MDVRASRASRADARLTFAQLRDLTDSLPHLVWTCLAAGPCDYLSRQWLEYTGIPEAEQLGTGWLAQLHPDDRERVKAEWAATVGGGVPFDIEFRIRRADGVYRWFRTRAIPVRNRRGAIVKWYGSNVDVDDYKRTEESLRNAERSVQRERDLHSAVVKNINEGICLVRAADAVLVYTNQKFDQMFGYEAGELHGRSAAILNQAIDETEARAVTDAIFRRIRERGEATYEVRSVRKDKRVITCRATASVIRDEIYGEVFAVVQEDVSEKKRLEEERDGFFRLSLDMLCVGGFDGYFKQLNPAWETSLGWTIDELKSKPWLDFVHPDDQTATVEEGLRLLGGETTVWFENRYRCKDGRYRVLEWRAVPSVVQGVIFCTARDATVLREMQEALKASNTELAARLREREVMLQEIHHRVKNNLQVISSLIRMQARRLPQGGGRGALEDCQSRVEVIALIHETLYQSKDYARVPFSEYARSLATNVLHATGLSPGSIRLELQIDTLSLALDKAIPCGLILNELMTNALKHAFPHDRSGMIRVELRKILDDRCILLAVVDDGVGMPEDFKPNRSTSLGMQLVSTLVDQLDGNLEIVRRTGTAFRVTFPAIGR